MKITALLVALWTTSNLLGADALEAGFLSPPATAKPRTLWMWMNGNVTADGITRDLESMRRAGLGGALIFNVGEYIPKGPVDYGSNAWLDLMVHAAREADRLGLELAMHNCPGWSSSGGPWITPERSMQQLVWSETRVAGSSHEIVALPQPFTRLGYYRDVAVVAFPSLPGEETSFADKIVAITNGQGAAVNKVLLTDRNFDTSVPAAPDNPLTFSFAEAFAARAVTIFYTSGGGTSRFLLEASDDGVNFKEVLRLVPGSPRAIEDASLSGSFEPVRARFYRVTPSRARGVCEVELHSAPRIPDWNYKAGFAFRSAREDGVPVEPPAGLAVDPAKVLDLSSAMDDEGTLHWSAPAGSWTVLRIGHTARGQLNIAAPDAGVGLECDKLNAQAVAFQFERGIGPLLKRLGGLAGKSFTGLEIDSYEVGMQNWTAGFDREFLKRNGYDLLRYLPAMTGRYVGGAGVSERFLWDLRRTQADLMADAYYGGMRELAAGHGLRLYVEPYGAGPGPYDELQIAGRADVPMGEFWAHFPWDDIPSIRLAASAAHVYGKPIVAGESFTSTEEQSRFLDYPYALKTTGDLAFSFGMNQMFFHRFAHQPHPTAVPGMTMGPWGFNFDRNNTWFDQSSGWLEYLARCQFLLQQGTFVADVLYFTGEGSPRISKRMSPGLPPGYDFDAIDLEALRQARVENGKVILPGGSSYRVLALPSNLKSATPALAAILDRLVSGGSTLVGPKPEFSPTLRDYPQSHAAWRDMVDKLWAPVSAPAGSTVTNGRVFARESVPAVLSQLNVQPDFEFRGNRADAALVWAHRRVGDSEIYFVANRQRRAEEVVCTFRVSGKRPEFWRPQTGDVEGAAVYEIAEGRTRVPMRFGPAESVFVVFRAAADPRPVGWIARNGEKVISTEGGTNERSGDGWTVTNNFTVMTWIKPDSDMTTMPVESLDGGVDENGKSWVVPAPAGGRAYGQGQAVMGLAAARNGLFVSERAGERAAAVLVSHTPLSGWTHVAVVYRDGRPSLYLNGKLDRDGLVSGLAVHPGVGAPPPDRQLVYYFDGDMTPVEAFPEAMSSERIAVAAAKRLPPLDSVPVIQVRRNANGEVAADIWRSGRYQLSDGTELNVPTLAEPLAVPGPWEVSFSAGAKAPATTTLSNLISLREQGDPAIRHFAGTVTYRTSFELPNPRLAAHERLWLDLGRVAVIAQVRVNGRAAGSVWMPPYRVEVSDFVKPGRNELEVRVTNLLVNRLIGDESLPTENEYSPRTRAITKLPDWFKQGVPKPPGGRSTFSTWKFFNKDDPLVESGLLGPVQLLSSAAGIFGK